MKILLISLVALTFLGACRSDEKIGTATSGGNSYTEICIDGVVYIRTYGQSGVMSVKFNSDSTVILCESDVTLIKE